MRRWIVLLAGCLVLSTFTDSVVSHHDISHQANTLYQRLLQSGLTVSKDKSLPLPAPFLADGLSTAEQRQVIQNLPGRTQDVDELLRLSAVAPFAVKFHDLPGGDSAAPLRSIDLAFVAQGSLDQLSKTDVLDRLLNSGRTDANITPLTQAEAGKTVQEAQAHVGLPLMDRVLLEGTIHTMWTRSDKSLVLAGQLDPRFTSDAKFPNRWTLMQRDGDGKAKPTGTTMPYETAAFYFKFTPLVQPAGALFIEWHLLFAEPAAWFDGANLLRSKLPLVLQTKIRAFRRDLLR